VLRPSSTAAAVSGCIPTPRSTASPHPGAPGPLGFTLAEIRVASTPKTPSTSCGSAYPPVPPHASPCLLGDAIAANEQLLERVDDRLERVRAFRQSAAEKADRLRRRARELDAELEGRASSTRTPR